jgi:hypothetical protein
VYPGVLHQDGIAHYPPFYRTDEGRITASSQMAIHRIVPPPTNMSSFATLSSIALPH